MKRDVFYAIADPTRRVILDLLVSKAMTPTILAAHFNSTRQAISKHIKILLDCGLLTQHQVGREIYYSVNADKMKDIELWLAQFRVTLNKQLIQLDYILKNLKHTSHD